MSRFLNLTKVRKVEGVSTVSKTPLLANWDALLVKESLVTALAAKKALS